MPIKIYKPTSPGRREFTTTTFDDITSTSPERALIMPLKKKGGRNSNGRITVRHRGGGRKRRYRVIDFKRDKRGVSAKVASIEYDPNRSARIALLHYLDGEKRYMLAPTGIRVGSTVISDEKADIKIGNALPLKSIPLGTIVHNIELRPGKGGQMARSAGAYAQLVAKEGRYAQLKLPSNEVRMVLLECYATIGQIGNTDHENVSLGKAGRKRWLGIRPTVRGTVMNPVDHPHGGGEGKSKGGNNPVTPWGVPTKGYKTRKNKITGKFIVSKRK